jgi:hypothetical protein
MVVLLVVADPGAAWWVSNEVRDLGVDGRRWFQSDVLTCNWQVADNYERVQDSYSVDW